MKMYICLLFFIITKFIRHKYKLSINIYILSIYSDMN